MATLAELRELIRAELRTEVPRAVWDATVPDFYTAAEDQMPAWAALAWGTTHAARARDEGAAARVAAAELNTALAQLPNRIVELIGSRTGGQFGTGSPITTDDVRALIREALADLGPLHLTPSKET